MINENFAFDIAGYTLIISIYLIWALITVGITTIFSIYHKKYYPAIWGWIVGFIFYFGADYLRPVLFGWYQYRNSNIVLFYLSFLIFAIFLLQWSIMISNTIKKGEVWI